MKKVIRELPFGKATARITVSAWFEKTAFLTDRLYTNEKVEIVVNGKVVEKGFFATILEYNSLTENYFTKAKLDKNQSYTRVGDKAITLGKEVGIAINETIKEMKAEIEAELQAKTNETLENERIEKEEIEVAKEVIALAEKEGVEKLLSNDELKVWRKNYNDTYNEGGEGYIPIKITKEQYDYYKNILASKE